MLSIASVRSASGAASYFAKDDYYTAEGSAEASAWGGEGAAALGLAGEVDKEPFEALLNGVLPGGEAVAQVENRRAGVDLTFSAPKSVSVMAYVGGDRRILGPDGANMRAVARAMAWAERNLAEGRKDVEGRKVPVATGNLVYALFQHDTSRALDPQAHVHAVIANLTRMPNGKWQALHADKLWSGNSLLGSIYHAFLRDELEKLGYVVKLKGKHGTFEIAGVPKSVLDTFSQRRQDILAKAAELGIKSAQGLRDVTARTRDPKLTIGDREVPPSATRQLHAPPATIPPARSSAAIARSRRR
jgi:conjugative relaxase-like TrwC/TraI family protein